MRDIHKIREDAKETAAYQKGRLDTYKELNAPPSVAQEVTKLRLLKSKELLKRIDKLLGIT